MRCAPFEPVPQSLSAAPSGPGRGLGVDSRVLSQNIRHPSLPRKAGRGFLRALKGLFGGRTVRRAAESWNALRAEYAAGRTEAEGKEPPPRPIPHREIGPGPGDPPRGPAPGATDADAT